MEADKALININLQPIADVANNLINKISAAVGWTFTRNTPGRIAVETLITDIQDMKIDPVHKAILISNANKIIKEYSNQEKIVQKACVYLEPNARPEKIEDDWIGLFMDKCRIISNDDFQVLWAMVLARESNNPGSIPIRVLSLLEFMDRKEAESFSHLCRTVMTFGDKCAPFIDGSRLKEYSQYGITLDSLVNLESLGLISSSLGLFAGEFALSDKDNNEGVLRYYNHEFVFQKENDSEILRANIGNVVFTRSGMALYKALKVEEIEGFWESYYIPYLRRIRRI